jgi:2-(1,2-epoxy-1,2-dihydrophenyl)acetyl-CoA isomerase
MGAAWLLPRIVGLGHASELLMLGEFIDAARAFQIGLYNKVVPAAELGAEAERWARKLADGPAYGLAVTKRMLNHEAACSLAEAMQLEGWIQAECMKHPDYRAGYEAALARRAPVFGGRAAGAAAP